MASSDDLELAALAWHWEGAYTVSRPEPGVWLAQRTDNRETLRARSPEELRDAMLADYTARPVPHELSNALEKR